MSLVCIGGNNRREAIDLYDKMCLIAQDTGGTRELKPIPFVIIRNCDNQVYAGFAVCAWVVEMYQWLLDAKLPEEHFHRIVGMLLGYSPSAIESFGAFRSGRLPFYIEEKLRKRPGS